MTAALSDLAPLIAAGRPGQAELGFHTGIVASWDAAAGTSTVAVAGTVFANVPVLSTSDSVRIAAGDVVGLLRYKTTYFILGRIGPAGAGALGLRSATVATEESTSSAALTDLATAGPAVADVAVGSSRQVLVLLGCYTEAPADGASVMALDVSGASTIPGDVQARSAWLGGTSGQVYGNTSASVLLTAGHGLNAGLNTFTAKYAKSAGTGAALFGDRTITVFPL